MSLQFLLAANTPSSTNPRQTRYPLRKLSSRQKAPVHPTIPFHSNHIFSANALLETSPIQQIPYPQSHNSANVFDTSTLFGDFCALRILPILVNANILSSFWPFSGALFSHVLSAIAPNLRISLILPNPNILSATSTPQISQSTNNHPTTNGSWSPRMHRTLPSSGTTISLECFQSLPLNPLYEYPHSLRTLHTLCRSSTLCQYFYSANPSSV
ncbi:hypothetical protein BDZ45DRAFT_755214 [Acephala macrosclerotiorum]|nr:hypothetical protein BDZ45DRAFT_755214 [Acephala macrosclerotiorum]